MKRRRSLQQEHPVSLNPALALALFMGLTSVLSPGSVASAQSTQSSDRGLLDDEPSMDVAQATIIPVLPASSPTRLEGAGVEASSIADPSASFAYQETPAQASVADPLAPLAPPGRAGFGASIIADPAASFVYREAPTQASVADPLAPLVPPHGSVDLIAVPAPSLAPLVVGPATAPDSDAQVTASAKVATDNLDAEPSLGLALPLSSAPRSDVLAPLVATPLVVPVLPAAAESLSLSQIQAQGSAMHLAQSGSIAPLTTPSPNATTSALIPDNRPITPPSLIFQPSLIQIGDDFSARARLQGYYFLSPNVLVGGAVDVTTGNAFSDTQSTGFSINELYIAASPGGAPNLRLVAGQLDLTSYFDRNSFAKDSLTHFINPVFQTNPALAANAIRSRPAALVNWRATDELEFKASAFSSGGVDNFSLDGFAGEVGLSLGNFIVRGTYVSATDAGNRDSFPQIFQTNRGNGVFGPLPDDREVAYGVNAEWFIPEANVGLFGRYGYHENQTLGISSDTFSGGINVLDLFMDEDRFGVGYGRGLSNEGLRVAQGGNELDVLEVFYDFRLAPNVRAAVDFQQRNNFSETYLGFRIRADFQLLNQDR